MRNILQSRLESFCSSLDIACSRMDDLSEEELQRETTERALWLVEKVQKIVDTDSECESSYHHRVVTCT